MIACKHYLVFISLLLLPLALFANRVCCWVPEFSQAQWVLCKSDASPFQVCSKVVSHGSSYAESACRNNYQQGSYQDC